MPAAWKPYTPTPAPEVSPLSPPAPATIQAAKEAGATAGTVLSAPLAPASGPIAGQPESLVVTVLKGFWQSPTVKAARNAIIGATSAAVAVLGVQILAANGDIFSVNWQTTEKAAIAALAFNLATAYMTWWKTRDNNPVNLRANAPGK